MKRLVRASYVNNVDPVEIKTILQHGPNGRYSVRGEYNPENGRIKADVTKLAAYDDADYVWARIDDNWTVKFIQDGKQIDRMILWSYEPDDYESVEEYVNDVLDQVVVELIDSNEDIKPVMIHY